MWPDWWIATWRWSWWERGEVSSSRPKSIWDLKPNVTWNLMSLLMTSRLEEESTNDFVTTVHKFCYIKVWREWEKDKTDETLFTNMNAPKRFLDKQISSYKNFLFYDGPAFLDHSWSVRLIPWHVLEQM